MAQYVLRESQALERCVQLSALPNSLHNVRKSISTLSVKWGYSITHKGIMKLNKQSQISSDLVNTEVKDKQYQERNILRFPFYTHTHNYSSDSSSATPLHHPFQPAFSVAQQAALTLCAKWPAPPGWVSASTSLNMGKGSLPKQEATAMFPSLQALPGMGEKLSSPQLPRHEQACISS